ncbi:MAG: hypothetical protein JKX74_04465 [Flavobacteriales bacterium]|nr:hypothetical protein [Flavobacteriales bacterium]
MAGIEPYEIKPPAIPSGSMYLFETDSGVEYEVRFGRKQNNILAASIVFGVLNEEFDGDDAGEYVVVNRGEIYRVLATVSEVIQMYIKEHPRMMSYEFTGENRQHEGDGKTSLTARTKFFLRYIKIIFGPDWKPIVEGNTVTVVKH